MSDVGKKLAVPHLEESKRRAIEGYCGLSFDDRAWSKIEHAVFIYCAHLGLSEEVRDAMHPAKSKLKALSKQIDALLSSLEQLKGEHPSAWFYLSAPLNDAGGGEENALEDLLRTIHFEVRRLTPGSHNEAAFKRSDSRLQTPDLGFILAARDVFKSAGGSVNEYANQMEFEEAGDDGEEPEAEVRQTPFIRFVAALVREVPDRKGQTDLAVQKWVSRTLEPHRGMLPKQ